MTDPDLLFGTDEDTPVVTTANDAPTIEVTANDFTEDAAGTVAGAVAGTYTTADEDNTADELTVSFTGTSNSAGYYELGSTGQVLLTAAGAAHVNAGGTLPAIDLTVTDPDLLFGTDEDTPVVTPSDPPQLIIDPNTSNIRIGGSGDDVMMGDQGGTRTTVTPGLNYNIALVVDVSGSMSTRMTLLKSSLNNLLDQLKNHDGVINISLIPFGTNSQTVTTVLDLDGSNVNTLVNAVGSLSANGGTNYEAAFNSATNWFNDPSVTNNYQDLTFFLTDGDPTYYLNDAGDVAGTGSSTNFATFQNAVSAFAQLSAVGGQVYGVGIGSGINSDYLRFFDTTNVVGSGSESFGSTSTVLADFDDNTGLNNLSSWTRSGDTGGDTSVGRSSDTLRIRDDRTSSDTTPVTLTLNTDQAISVQADQKFSFSYRTEDFNTGDVFTWKLVKLDGSSWVDVQTGIVTTSSGGTTVTTNALAAGQYGFVFQVLDGSGNNGDDFTVRIDNIALVTDQTVTGPIGEGQIVTTAAELTAVLINGSTNTELLAVGDDVLLGGAGDDLIFGDTPYSGVGGAGWSGVVEQAKTALGISTPPTDEQMYDYIKANLSTLLEPDPSLSNSTDTRGGNDTITGGAGNDTMYGQGGNDTFVWNDGDQGTAANPAVDHIGDFNRGDKLDLHDLLQAEDSSNLNQFLSVGEEGGKAVLNVSATANGAVTQKIFFDNMSEAQLNALYNDASGADIIAKMKAAGGLITD